LTHWPGLSATERRFAKIRATNRMRNES